MTNAAQYDVTKLFRNIQARYYHCQARCTSALLHKRVPWAWTGGITQKENELGVSSSCPGDKSAPNWKPVVAKQQQTWRDSRQPHSTCNKFWLVESQHTLVTKTSYLGWPDGSLWSATKYKAEQAAKSSVFLRRTKTVNRKTTKTVNRKTDKCVMQMQWFLKQTAVTSQQHSLGEVFRLFLIQFHIKKTSPHFVKYL